MFDVVSGTRTETRTYGGASTASAKYPGAIAIGPAGELAVADIALEHGDSLFAWMPWRWSPDGRHLAHIATDEYRVNPDSIQIYDAQTGKRERELPGKFDAVGWAAPGGIAFVESIGGRVRLLRLIDHAMLDLAISGSPVAGSRGRRGWELRR